MLCTLPAFSCTISNSTRNGDNQHMLSGASAYTKVFFNRSGPGPHQWVMYVHYHQSPSVVRCLQRNLLLAIVKVKKLLTISCCLETSVLLQLSLQHCHTFSHLPSSVCERVILHNPLNHSLLSLFMPSVQFC